jgi:hypothetical protein
MCMCRVYDGREITNHLRHRVSAGCSTTHLQRTTRHLSPPPTIAHHSLPTTAHHLSPPPTIAHHSLPTTAHHLSPPPTIAHHSLPTAHHHYHHHKPWEPRYIVSQLPGGFLATRYGGKRVILVSMISSVIITCITPMASRVSLHATAACRVMLGLSSGCLYVTLHHPRVSHAHLYCSL